jgi:flagellin-specific chaperone FliS
MTIRFKTNESIRKEYIARLERARVVIENFYRTQDYEQLGKCAKNFKDLYAECYGNWHSNNFKDDVVFEYAEYLRFLILNAFHECFNYYGGSNSFVVLCREHARKAGIKSAV